MASQTQADPVLAAVLRRLRIDTDQTQEDVAHAAGLTVGAVGLIERAQMNPSWLVLRGLADGLGVSLVEIAEAVEAEEG